MNYEENIFIVLIGIIGALAVAMLFITIGVAIQENTETKLMDKNCNGNAFVRNNSVYVCVKVKAEVIK